jgi:hypothetical protein
MGRTEEAQMADQDDARREAGGDDLAAERAEEVARKTEELEVFRDAGVLTETELEELKAKARWA